MLSRKFLKFSLGLLSIVLILLEPPFKSQLVEVSVIVAGESNNAPGIAENLPMPSHGKSSTRELSANEIHSYQITLQRNQYLHAVVEQSGVNVGVTLYDPDGRIIIQLQCRGHAPTPVSLMTEKTGVYRFELRSLEKQDRGRYQLQTLDIRSAASNDRRRMAAESNVAEGEALLQEWKAESNRKAMDKFKLSLPDWKLVGDYSEEALTLRRIGNIYQGLGDYRSALAFYEQSLAVSRTFKHRPGESEALGEIGYIYISLGQKRQALEYCNRALNLSENSGSHRTQARALNNLGEVHNWSGDLQTALGYYRRALDLWTNMADRAGQAQTHTYLGYAYSDLGHAREAFDSYNRSLALWQAIDNRRGQGITLTAIGRLYSRIGESQEALNFFQRAMHFIQPLGDPFEEASILNGIAYVHDQLGEKRKAIEYYEQALPRFRTIGFSNAHAMTVYDAGRAHYSLGDHQRALECYEEALAISRASGDRRLESMELREIGKVYDSFGERERALDYYRRALSFWTEADFREKADTLNPIGRIYEGWGNKQKALEYYQKALDYSRKADYRVGEAAVLHNIARVERDRGNVTVAQLRAEQAISVIETLRDKVDSQDLRTSYFSSVRQQYEFYIDLLMLLHRQQPDHGFQEAAFEASERARARSFLETLAVARVGLRSNADPALLDRESKLSNQLNDKAAQRMQLHSKPEPANAEEQALAKEIDELAWQLREVEAQIRAGTMKQAASLETRPLPLSAIQERVLDNHTLLLEYALGEERSYLWAISKDTVLSYELPKRAEIEAVARSVYILLTANQPRPDETFQQRQDRVRTANEQLASEVATLSKILLEPVAGELGTKRLLIVADGALQYIPFQILIKPTGPNQESNAAPPLPLLADHEIVNESSASALALLVGDNTIRKQPLNSVAVFADPVFEADDPRIKSATNTATGLVAPQLRVSISRLPASRHEAEAIIAAAPWWSTFKAMGFEANRATAMKSDLSNYRIVHFATHGFLNDEHPELSGVVLSMFDDAGQAQDGFLRLHDVYNLKLPVELVVLSACNTGLGKDIRGEGLIGLTRGFMYAGASSVVASLWKVDDEATAELMKRFYSAMLQDGLSPAASLRKAQLEMYSQKRWQSPYYWSGFVIQGQYVQRHPTPSPRFGVVTAAAGAVIALLFVWHMVRKQRREQLH